MKRRIIVATVAFLTPLAARAQCTASAMPVNFGVYLPFSASPTDSTGGVTIACAQFAGPYTIFLSQGLNGGGSFANRRMNGGIASRLRYQLYTNATRTTVWGDGSGNTGVVVGTCASPCNATHTVYGRIPALQAVRPGSYADTITVTITF